MNDLITLLRSDSRDALEGAMQVISDLVMESLDEAQLPYMTRELLPTLMVILKNENVRHSVCVAETSESLTALAVLGSPLDTHQDL